MAERHPQPQDISDSSSGLTGISESHQGKKRAYVQFHGISLQRLNLSSSAPHVQQEVKHILDTYGKAIVSQGIKSDHLVTMMEQVLVLHEKSENAREDHVKQMNKLAEGLRQQEMTIQQLQATLAVQEAEVARLQMDLARLEQTSYTHSDIVYQVEQELKDFREIYSKAIISQGIKADHIVQMMEHVLTMYQKVQDITKELKEQMKKLVGDLRQKEMSIQQLQASVAVRVAEDASFQMGRSRLERTSYDGLLLIEIKDYARKKTEAQNGPTSFYSDDFYTHSYGYKICAQIYLNGEGVGKDTHLSIFFALKKGDHDNYLKWPFQRRVRFTLVNQDGKEDLSDAFRPDATSSSFQKPSLDMNIASGIPMFVSHSVLENPREGFLRNNTICLKVMVDPL